MAASVYGPLCRRLHPSLTSAGKTTGSEGPPTLCKWGCTAQQPGVHPREQLPASGLQPPPTQRRLTPRRACGDGQAGSAGCEQAPAHSLPLAAVLRAPPAGPPSQALSGPLLPPPPPAHPMLGARAQQRPTQSSQSERGDKIAPARQNLSVVSPHRPEPFVCRRVYDGTQEDFAGAGHPVGTAAAQLEGA